MALNFSPMVPTAERKEKNVTTPAEINEIALSFSPMMPTADDVTYPYRKSHNPTTFTA